METDMSPSVLVLLRWNAGGNPLAATDQRHAMYEQRVLQAVRKSLFTVLPNTDVPSHVSFKAVRVDTPGANDTCVEIVTSEAPEMVIMVVDPDEANPGICHALAELVAASGNPIDHEVFYGVAKARPSNYLTPGLPGVTAKIVESMVVASDAPCPR